MEQREWVFESRLDEVHAAAARVRAFCECMGFDEMALTSIELCVYEAFVNVVEHAYGHHPDHEVWVRVRRLPDALRVWVCQFGVPLDPALIAAVPSGFDDLPLDLDALECEPRSRGLRLIKACMATVEVETEGDRACLVMTKPLPSAESGPIRVR